MAYLEYSIESSTNCSLLSELFHHFLFAKLSLNSTQFQLELRLSWFYFHLIQQPPHPPNHPPNHPPTHPQEKFQLKLKRSQIKKDWFKTTLGLLQAILYTSLKLIKEYLNFKNTSMPQCQLNANHVCMILSCRRDTSFQASFWHWKSICKMCSF